LLDSIALGEMTLAKDVLSLFLSSTAPAEQSHLSNVPPGVLTSSTVSKPPPIPSVRSFSSQLSTGGKDEALRKAADLFRAAADGGERGRQLSEQYWMDALKIRRRNWGLIPAPLPFGAPAGRGADKTSKDFLISFGLEECKSLSHHLVPRNRNYLSAPPVFRRRALGQLASYDTASGPVLFPQRQKVALRVSLSILDATTGSEVTCFRRFTIEDLSSLDGILRDAQREVVEQEIFSALIQDAGHLPTTSARVSERLIAIEVTQGVELCFELVYPPMAVSYMVLIDCVFR